AHLYQADLALTAPLSADSLVVAPSDPTIRVELYGIGLIDSSGAVHSLEVSDRAGLQRLNDMTIQDTSALPRAFVLPMAQAFSPGRHPGLTATQLVASPDMDAHSMVLIENDPGAPSAPLGSLAARPARQIEDIGPNAVRVVADAGGPSYLVLSDFYHRGWTAQVDGQAARVFIANALFRAVAIDAGTHT